MNEEEYPPFDENMLSPEDLAILQAFEAKDSWDIEPSGSPASPIWSDPPTQKEAEKTADDVALNREMRQLFISEVQEDLERMQQVLFQLEHDDTITPIRFTSLKRTAHKIRGTAGAVECYTLATIADGMEILVDQVNSGMLFPVIAVNALILAVCTLEDTLVSLVEQGKESEAPLRALEAEYEKLGIHLQEPAPSVSTKTKASPIFGEPGEPAPEQIPFSETDKSLHEEAVLSASIPLLRVDARRVDQLILHSEHLMEHHVKLESAQAQIESALEELRTAQARLQQFEPELSSLLKGKEPPPQPVHKHSSSSLIARILQTSQSSPQRSMAPSLSRSDGRMRPIKANGNSLDDELNIERYDERDMLLRSLREAIADVGIATTRVLTTSAHLRHSLQEYTMQATAVRSDTLLLRLTPFSTLVPQLRQTITTSVLAKQQEVQFEVTGESTEVDQDILKALTDPLLQLLNTCITDSFVSQENDIKKDSYRVWVHAQGIGNELVLEVGFSMTIHGGAIEVIRDSILRLKGTITLQRNATGGISFHLRLPRSYNAAHCLLVQVNGEQVIVPLSQVQHIGNVQQEQVDMLYRLDELLHFSKESVQEGKMLLILPQSVSHKTIGVVIDEVVDEVELVVKPVASYLQRPGIAGAAVDGKGSVLLMVDLPELINQYIIRQRHRTKPLDPPPAEGEAAAPPPRNRQPKILVVDDSVYFRQTLLQTLKHANYQVLEARDGLEAIELSLANPPDIFLLDVEMPNLNGYDVLNVMRRYPELAHIKVIMLTSRSSEQHMQRARELGAHAYLTKPCPHEILIEQIQKLLT
jgi:chemosensory pili system protein ChpA (sensor histidine kinase/response regulator)